MNKLVLTVALAAGSIVFAADGEGASGAKLWKAKCAQCHGMDGKGQTKQGIKMGISDATKPEWQKEFTDQKIKDVLSTGVKRERNGKKQEMDPIGKELQPDELSGLISYIRSLEAAPPAAPAKK